MIVNHKKIADKWQKNWSENKVFESKIGKKNFYVLEMYPYPSASGLHMGHALNYTIGDIFARSKRMQGFNVMYPMGFDSFGLPAENAAIKAKSHPKKFTEEAISNYIKQMKSLGLSYDWERKVETHKPDYYKWDQWIFLEMYKKGLVYKKKSGVNWCPDCNTVLANEQVHDGKCWRHSETNVEVKQLSQWYLKITKYADELYEGIEKLSGWPEIIKKLQKNWIGKSHGTEITFKINNEDWKIFTTRPDTLYGVTFMVISAQHDKLMSIVTPEQKKEVESFVKKIHSVKEEDVDQLEKEGVFTGAYAKHPITGENIPVWAGNFVLAEYGSGMVMAVPAHDQRDFEFAQKYGIPIKQVVKPKNKELGEIKKAYTEDGVIINSLEFDGLSVEEGKKKITAKLKFVGKGKPTVNYRLRDWLISRQRYWGTPIPVYYDEEGKEHPVPEEMLPIKLPEDVIFEEGKGNPLETSKKHFIELNGKKYKLETDTMDTFVNSSWYYLRYCDPKNDQKIFNPKKVKEWCPVNLYIGGKEHACMHLIYIRFYTKFLRDLGLLDFDEPAQRLFNQGMLNGPDGEKMSKSKGNVVLPETVSNKFGLDPARMFLVSVASQDKDLNWSDKGAEGSLRFINKVFSYIENIKFGKTSEKVQSKLHSTIKAVTENIDLLRYNFAVIKLRDLFESFEEEIAREDLESFIKLMAPIVPHSAEEWWQMIGNKPFVSLSSWPKYDETKINESLEYLEELTEKLRADISGVLKLAKIEKPKKIKLIISPKWKYEFVKLFKEVTKTSRNPKDIIGKVMSTDLKKHGQDVMKMIPAFLKDESKLPKQEISIELEKKNLEESKPELEKIYSCILEIELADVSKEDKARNAIPENQQY